MKLLIEYSKKVFLQWRSIHGIVTFALLTIPVIITANGKSFLLPTWAWMIILLLNLHLSGYQAYKEVFEKLPKPVDVSIVCTEAKVKPSAFNQQFPLSPIVYVFKLSIANNGTEKIALQSIDISKIETGVLWITYNSKGKRLRKNDGQEIKKPYFIEPGTWELDMELEINANISDIHEESPLVFAENVSKMKNYEVEMNCKYVDRFQKIYSQSLKVNKSYEGFQKTMLSYWKESKYLDLVIKASGI